jgi:hypothetical protein
VSRWTVTRTSPKLPLDSLLQRGDMLLYLL